MSDNPSRSDTFFPQFGSGSDSGYSYQQQGYEFYPQFNEMITLYKGVRRVWIGEGGTTGDAGVLYAEYVDGRTQRLGFVSDYNEAKDYFEDLGIDLSYEEWIEMLANMPANADTASAKALEAAAAALDAEAWATGKRNGTDVGSTDEAYHNNAKYYSEQAAGSATQALTAKTAAETAQTGAVSAKTAAETAETGANTAKTAAQNAAKRAEAWANGQIDGTDVPSTDDAYHNNALYYAGQAASSAQAASASASNAASSETNAQAYKNAAQEANTAAQTAKTDAQTANTAAQTAKTDAQTAKTGADAAKADAISAKNAAQSILDNIQTTVDTALAAAKASGDFDGNGIDSAELNQDYTLTLHFTDGTSYTTPISIRGETGDTGTTFTPAVSAEGVISWTNDGGAQNPQPINIKGPIGETGAKGDPFTYQDFTPEQLAALTGPRGATGDTGTTFTPSVNSDGDISWTNDGGKTNPTPVNIKGPRGETGATGSNGITFTPSVSAEGVISWTNNGGAQNPQSVNIKGPRGDNGSDFEVKAQYASVAAMEADFSNPNIAENEFVIIISNDSDNAKVYIKGASAWQFVGKMEGAKGDKGDTGDPGADGNGIASAVLNQDYTLTLNFTDGTHYTTPNSIRGATGETGASGSPGAAGNGISSAVLNQDYTLTLTFTDGNSYTTPVIRGAQGDTGHGVASGGETGQFLAKASGVDYDTEWQTLDLSGKKDVQTAVSDPTASGNSLSFIDSISQDTQGVITATKKSVTVDASPTENSLNPVQSGGVYSANAAQNTQIANLKSDLGVVEDTDTATHTISKGQYVIWKGVLYTAKSAIPSGTALSSSNLEAVSGGGLNALNSNITNLLVVNSKDADNITVTAGGTQSISINIEKEGYTPIAIARWQIGNATTSGLNSSRCVPFKCSMASNLKTVEINLRNLYDSADAKIRMVVWILYCKNL